LRIRLFQNLRILQVRYFLIGLASREKEEKEYQCKSTG